MGEEMKRKAAEEQRLRSLQLEKAEQKKQEGAQRELTAEEEKARIAREAEEGVRKRQQDKLDVLEGIKALKDRRKTVRINRTSVVEGTPSNKRYTLPADGTPSSKRHALAGESGKSPGSP